MSNRNEGSSHSGATKTLADDTRMAAIDAVTGRRSVRRFLDAQVSEDLVYAILRAASRAPSGQNMQPWLVHYVTGVTRARLCREVTAAAEAGERSDEYAYFPQADP